MEALVIQSAKGQDVTTSLIVAEKFGKDHKNVVRDIEALHCSEEFRALNFEHTPYTHPQNKQTYSAYQMTKNGFSFLVMGYTGEKAGQFKEQFISEFDKRTALLQNDDFILTRALNILNERTKLLEAQVSQTSEQLQLANATIEKQAPAVMYVTQVLQSNNCYTTTSIAKELGMGAPTLNQLLKDLKIQYKHDGHWVLYQQFQEKGYTKTRTHTYYDSENKQQTSMQTVWTEKGRAYIHKRINQYKATA